MSSGRVSAAFSVALHALLLVAAGRYSGTSPGRQTRTHPVEVTIRWLEPPDSPRSEPALEPETEPETEAAKTVKARARKERASSRASQRTPRSSSRKRGRDRAPARPPSEPSELVEPPAVGPSGGGPGAGARAEGTFGPGTSDGLDLEIKPKAPSPEWVTPRPPPPPSSKVPEDYVLKPRRGGGFIVQDRQIWAEIHRDGRITFHDRPWFRPKVPEAAQRGRQALAAAADRRKIAELDDLANPAPAASFSMDLNDAILRAIGDDPYGGIKRDILKKTQELREELAEKACKEDLQESIAQMKSRLTRVWSKTHLSARDRRRKLFELWDECLEGGDDMRAQAGRMAREAVVAFIQRHLPSTSGDAYPPAELRALNERRRSQARFEPYGSL